MTVKISVIIPVYNVEAYLVQCLDSVVNQTLRNIEIIIIDDGSNDNSLAICEKYEKAYDNVILIRHPHLGVSKARNAGIKAARGEYIAFVDSDDYIDPDMYKILYETAESNKLDLIMCKHSQVDKNGSALFISLANPEIAGRIMSKSEGLYHLFYTHIMSDMPWDKIYKRSVLLYNKIFFPEGVSSAVDAEFGLKVYLNSARIMLIDECMYFWRVDKPGRITTTTSINPKKMKDRFGEYYKVAMTGYSLDDCLLPKAYKNYYIEDKFIGIVDREHFHFYKKDIFHYYTQICNNPILLYGSEEDNILFLEGLAPSRCEVILFDEEKDSLQALKEALAAGARIWISSRGEFFRRLVRLSSLGLVNDVSDVLPFNGETELERVYLNGYTQMLEEFGVNYLVHDFNQLALKPLREADMNGILEMIDLYTQPRVLSHFSEDQKVSFLTRIREVLMAVYQEYQKRNFSAANLLGKIDYNAKIAFFGASKLGEQYLCMGDMRFKNLVFLDSDRNKEGTYLFGYKIMHPESFEAQAKDYKIYITSMYFVEIAEQLLNMGIIQSLHEIMVFDGQLENEAMFCETLGKLFNQSP